MFIRRRAGDINPFALVSVSYGLAQPMADCLYNRRWEWRPNMDDFESFTREHIARLRAEADALEKTLKAFVATKARQTGAIRRSGDQPRAGAFGVVMDAIVGAGEEGLDLDQMIEAAAAEGYEVKRATLRSQVWQAKENGVLTQMKPGRYRSSAIDAFADVKLNPTIDRFLKADANPRETFTADLDEEIPF